jgi:hypothetical protein
MKKLKMKKPILSTVAVTLLLCIPLFFPNCRKSDVRRGEPDATELIAQARAFVANDVTSRPAVLLPGNPRNERTQRQRDIVWANASIMNFRGQPAVVAPLHFPKEIFVRTPFGGNNNYRLDNQAKLLVYQDTAKAWHAEVVTSLPDTNFLHSTQSRFSGLILVEDWWGNPINKYMYMPDGRVLRLVPGQDQDASATPKPIADKVTPDVMIQVCSYISGYNYAVGAEDDGEYWEEFVGCTFMWAPDEGGGGGGSAYNGVESGGGALPSTTSTVANMPPGHPIKNLADYLKCYTNVGGTDHRYTVTVCVDQPTPGTRMPWRLVDGGPAGSSATQNIVDVGHTFLVFTEQYGSTTITRNIGFYPSGMVTPLNPASPGVFDDNEDDQFNVSATFTVTSANFFIMLNYLQQATNPPLYYNLNSENCTTFALQTLSQGGIFLPSTIGVWIKGSGNDPGDLGEDIRQMAPLPNMTKSTTNGFHFNVGVCQ